MEKKPILKVKDLGISFSQYTAGLRRNDLKVISSLDVELYEGEILAVVGSSGSGKSLLASAILGILPDNACLEGEIYYKGMLMSQKDKEKYRGKEIALIPQSVNYLDPLQPVGAQIGISIRRKANRNELIEKLFCKYGLAKEVARYYPFQLSGGMARKVLLATALASNAGVIIADEPTPGLDEAPLLEVLKDFRALADNGSTILIITHDIEAALRIADRITIFYAGTTLETANTKDFENGGGKLRHPYTKALNQARPDTDFLPIPGTQPYPGKLPAGCLFSDRCSFKTWECERQFPEYREIRDGRVRCNHAT